MHSSKVWDDEHKWLYSTKIVLEVNPTSLMIGRSSYYIVAFVEYVDKSYATFDGDFGVSGSSCEEELAILH